MALSQVSIFLFVCFNKCFLFLPKGPDTDLHLLFFYCPVYYSAAMSLQAFSFPVSETRFLKAGSFIYNFNIIAGSSFRQDSLFFIYNELQQRLSQLFWSSFTPLLTEGKACSVKAFQDYSENPPAYRDADWHRSLPGHISLVPSLSLRLLKAVTSACRFEKSCRESGIAPGAGRSRSFFFN